jgi:hypothetical protein
VSNIYTASMRLLFSLALSYILSRLFRGRNNPRLLIGLTSWEMVRYVESTVTLVRLVICRSIPRITGFNIYIWSLEGLLQEKPYILKLGLRDSCLSSFAVPRFYRCISPSLVPFLGLRHSSLISGSRHPDGSHCGNQSYSST